MKHVIRTIQFAGITILLLGAIPDTSAETRRGWLWDGGRFVWWKNNGFSRDWDWVKSEMTARGISVNAAYTVDTFGNTTGGLNRGVDAVGLLQFGGDLDLEKAVGWPGASVSTTWFWINGQDASANLVGNLLTISNIAAFNTFRLSELWFQQTGFDGAVSLRIGQLEVDSEFMFSDYGSLFINGTFGWPAFAYLNLPNGGPGYPMGTLGVRLSLQPTSAFTLMVSALQGNVFEQSVNRFGFRYRLNASEGYTFLNEVHVRWDHAGDAQRLPGQFKAGIWFQSGRWADALVDSTASGNLGLYGILDQLLTREAPDSDQGLGSFLRIAFNPTDRNFSDFYLDGGLTYKGVIPTRDDDTLGIAFGLVQTTRGARATLASEGFETAQGEMVLETTYQAEVTKWLNVQPDLQWIIYPGATRDLNNAFLVGIRAAIAF